MSTINSTLTVSEEDHLQSDNGEKPGQGGSYVIRKSGKQVANQNRATGKTSSLYWKPRLFLPVNDRGIASPHYSMKVAFRGKRMAFSTRTSNKDSAAKIAAGIFSDLLTLGVDATLAKHRAKKATKADSVVTVGEWIEAARKVSAANEATFTSYSRAMRQIASGIVALKKDKKRFGPKKGGSTKYRAAVDCVSLEAFTPTAIQMWRLAYVKKRANNPAKERAAMTSCNSIVRQARSLFAPKVVKFLDGLILPTPTPFADVEFYERQSAKYISRIDVRAILQQAKAELATTRKPTFLALLLSVGAGLRRGEMDSLQWHQVDTAKKVIRIEITDVANLKTEDSRGEVEIDDHLAAILQGHKAEAKGKGYVIVSKALVRKSKSNPGATPWGQKYRADDVFNDLIAWLRLQGVEARKPIHEMRKELGALITQEHGIYAASRALRHSNVATTAAHYADKKARTTVDIGGMLNPPNVISLPKFETETKKTKQARR